MEKNKRRSSTEIAMEMEKYKFMQ